MTIQFSPNIQGLYFDNIAPVLGKINFLFEYYIDLKANDLSINIKFLHYCPFVANT